MQSQVGASLDIGGFEAIIFDCDGVLVDSEPISARTLVSSLRDFGYGIDEAYVYKHYLGRSFATIAADFHAKAGTRLPDAFLAHWQDSLFDAFRRDLRPIAGIHPLLDRLTVPFAVVSSSAPERLALCLQVADLARYFENRTFNAAMVSRGKPAPDLFLLAAEHLGVDPRRILAIEDSVSGIEAACGAGMIAWGFEGGAHFPACIADADLLTAGATLVFDDMRRIEVAITLRNSVES